MSDSKDIREQLSGYLDGELSPERSAEVELALANDAALAKELAAIKASRDLVRALPREKAPEDFAARVLGQAERMHLVQEFDRPPESSGFGWLPFAATAAIVLIAASICATLIITLYSASKIPAHIPPMAARTQAKPVAVAQAPEVESRLAARDEMLRVEAATTQPVEVGETVVIQTARLDEAQREVERTLAANSVGPETSKALTQSQPAANWRRGAASDEKVVYEVVVADAQMPELQRELTELQTRQGRARSAVEAPAAIAGPAADVPAAEPARNAPVVVAAPAGSDRAPMKAVRMLKSAGLEAARPTSEPMEENAESRTLAKVKESVKEEGLAAKKDVAATEASGAKAVASGPATMPSSLPSDARLAQQVCLNAASQPEGLKQESVLLRPTNADHSQQCGVGFAAEGATSGPAGMRRLTILLELRPAAGAAETQPAAGHASSGPAGP